MLDGSRRILQASRDPIDGTWVFLDADLPRPEELVDTTLIDVLLRDPSLRMVSRLLPGWSATRRTPGSRWRVQSAPLQSGGAA